MPFKECPNLLLPQPSAVIERRLSDEDEFETKSRVLGLEDVFEWRLRHECRLQQLLPQFVIQLAKFRIR